MESLMMGEEIMSFNSCVTTMAAVRCFLAVFQSSSMYVAIWVPMMAFQASSIHITLKSLLLDIFSIKASMMTSVVMG